MIARRAGRAAAEPAQATIVLISFEGPDRYATAGGLGVRVAWLSRTLAAAGLDTHVVFVGEPAAPGYESPKPRLHLHRWSQWISRYYPGGVYEGEEAKLYDVNESLPGFVVETLARPAIEAGRLVVVMGEEWHTAEAMCRISDRLWHAGLRSRAVLLWNANNTMGFDRIDWPRLEYVTALTTVSRYMKRLMWPLGVNPLVIPNGIPATLLEAARPGDVGRLRRSLGAAVMLLKVGRWNPDKRWLMAVETVADLRARGRRTTLVALGGVEPHQAEVLDRARHLGLRVRDVVPAEPTVEAWAAALHDARDAEVAVVRAFAPLPLLRTLYRAADAVLANSGHEPFGLVGLETMASGGIAITGGTGEEYAVHLENAIVLDTADPAEASWYVRFLGERREVAAGLARAARATAGRFVWERVLVNLLAKVDLAAANQGVQARRLLAPPLSGGNGVRAHEPTGCSRSVTASSGASAHPPGRSERGGHGGHR
ncbi:MAG: glycosyltransferase family 4 protein [Candidatus Rokubacteria bacterium]|nr:glycosyltransferase family 4 protein [Candidatus Rokubacteria bacterium]